MKRLLALVVALCMFVSLGAGIVTARAAEPTQPKVYFDLDFEDAADINKLTKRSYSSYADGQSVTTAESGNNHYAHIGLNGGMAYMVSLVPEETVGNFEMSVKMREIGSSSSSTSIWLFDSGNEDGYRFLFEDNRVDMRLPGAGEATVSANMDAGYRTEDRVYTFKVVGSVLTLSVDGEEVLKYENATTRPANGITFGGWSHDLALDDILWKEVTAEDSGDDNTGDSTETKVYFDLDFEDAADINKLTKRSYSGYANNQSVAIAESGENHYAHIGLNGGMAYMVSLVPEETVGNFEMSVKMREIGSSSSSTSIWLFDSGNEDGYRFLFEDNRIDMRLPGAGEATVSANMDAGYRTEDRVYTFKVVGSVLTLSVDGEEVLKYENATTRPANGITFGGWSHDLALDDILWKEATAEDSDDDIIYEDISLEEFLSQIPEDSLAHDVLNNCLYEIDLGKWYTDVNEAAGHYGASHLQGFCCDDKGEYFYASFTNILVKTDMKTGEIVGVVKGMATGSITGGAHIGDLCYYDGTVYGSLEYKTAERFYICAFDVEKIDGVVNYNDPGVMYGMYIPQVGDDFVDNLNAGEHNNEESSMGHRYGTSGIDGITFGTLPGKGYDTDGDGDVDVSTGDERFMIVAQCAYQNAKRYDNENLILLVFDVDDITADNMLPFTEELLNQEYTDAQKLLYKHKVFVYTGNQMYGVQQLEFDEETGDLLLECYGSADGSEFPKGSRFVIDGSVPLYMDAVEVGQSVTGNASGFVTQAAAHTTAALYTDYQDGDGDGNTSEQETGWHATLKCICGENKKLDTNHAAVAYGATGHTCRICVGDAQFTEGLRSLGNDLFYGATSGGNSSYQYGSASLYWLNRYTYSYEKITPPAVDAFGTVLDFEDANDINAFVKQSYSGFAGQQGVSITTDGENHVAYLKNSGTSVNASDGEAAYMVTLNSENATDDFKVSFKYKFADGDTGEGTSVWVYDSGEENGYQVLFLNNSIELRAPGGVENALTSVAMQNGYRRQDHTYTITCVGNVLTVSVDDKTVLKYEEIGNKASDGITFSGWFHEIYLDDIHWQEATEADIGEVEIPDDDNTGDNTEAKVYFDLDFEDATDINKLTKRSYSGFANNQSVAIAESGDNHYAQINRNGDAYMVSLVPEETVGNYEMSVKMREIGSSSSSTSIWLFDSGTEDGYRFLFEDNRIDMRLPGAGEATVSANMDAGYRTEDHVYTFKVVGSVLTLSVDGEEVLKYENATAKPANGITFGGWSHDLALDDILWKEVPAEVAKEIYLDLDFEDAADVDAFTQRSYFTYADGQTIEVVEDGADHAVKLSNGSYYAFMQSLVPEETVGDFEVSFKYKFAGGTSSEGTSVWVYDSGNEDGYQILLLEDKMELRAPGGGEDVLIDATMESGYRDAEHTYTVKSVGSVLTVSMDGTEVLKYEEIGTKASNGITFSGWNHEIYLDDILWEAIPAEVAKEIYLDLDFEDATHEDAFSKNDFSGYASDQIVEIVEDGEENHVLEVGATTLGWDASRKGSNAYMIYNIPTEQVEDFELSFKYKFVSGNKAEGTSVWVRNNGSENGYAFRLTENMIILEQYQNNQYQNATQLGVVSMPEGYRDSWKTYTVTCEGTVLTLQVDGDTVITYEQADYYGERGICFTGWYHFIHLDDVLMTNLAPGANQVYTPQADVPSGDVMEGTAVSLTCKTEGATIFYTVDGTAPTAESTQYTAPIVITADTTLKAIAIKEGMDNSRVLTRTYKMLDLGGMLSKEIMYLSVGDVSAISDLFENTETQAEMTAKFTSSDESVVTVDERGFVEAKATGTAKITASVEIEGTDIAIGECTVVVNSACSMFYYIAPNGSDSNPGTIDAPFATLEHARDVIRGISLPEGGVTIYFREGEYYLDDKVVFGTQDSGEPGKPIVYASYPGEDAMIHSGRKLEGWTLLQEEDYPAGLPNAAKGNTYVLDIETGWRFHDLYVNGERQQVARQINSSDYHDWEGFDTTPTLPTRQTDAHEKGMFIKFNDGDLKDVPGNGDVEVYLLTAVWWNCLPVVKDVNEADDTARLHSYMPSILPEWDHCFQIEDDEIGRYNLMNAPKFLDEAGEWCVDSQNGKVYFWPKNADDLNKTVAPVADELIRLEGDGEAQNWANQVEFIEFRDLEFAYVDRRGEDELIDENEAEPILLRNSENPYSAIFMRGTSNIAIVDCVIRHAGAYAVSMHNYSQYNRVVGTLMEDLGAGGVEIYGYGAGFVDNNGHHTIIGNNISDIGLAPYEHSSAVTMFGTSYNDVKLNKISNVPYTAIMMAGTEANLMNPNKKNDPIIICDCYGNQGAGNNVRWAEMDQVPEAYHFEWQLRGEDASMPYQHLDYNTCTYNSAFEYMMRLSDGGCYYGFYTGRNNEYSYNTAYKSGYSSSGGMCWPLYADNAFRNSIWIGNAVCAPQTGFAQTAENMVWKDNVSESYGTDYHDQLENTIANLTAEYLGGWLTKSETLPVITVAPRAAENLINAIGTVTLDSKDAIEAARAAYDDLTEAQKSMVSNADKLTSAEEKYAELKEEADQNAVDEAAANAVEELISALDPVTLDSKEAIDATRAAYDALTDAQKQLVSNLSELVEAETKYAELKAADEQAKADQAAAKVVVDLIDAIGTVSLDSKETIEAARTAYDALTDAQKRLISNVDALLLAEAKYADLSAVKSVEDKIAAIGDVTLESKANIDAAREAYEALTAGQKDKVTNLDVLTAAEAKYAELKAEADQQVVDKAAAKVVVDLIDAIGTVSLDSKEAIDAARAAYDALTAAQKELVTNLNVLAAAEEKYAELEEAAPGDVIVESAPGNANGATFADSQNVAGKIELTDAEKKAIEDGDDITISLKVQDISTTVSKDTKDKIAAVAGDYTVGLYLDISIFKQVGDEDPVAITKTNGAVKISIVVPDTMINTDPTVTRSYSIIRVHNGVAQILPTTFNSSTKTVTFESDSFSEYALAYKDVKKDTSDTPKTGDTAKLGMWIALMAVAVAGIVIVFIPMLKKRNYKAKY